MALGLYFDAAKRLEMLAQSVLEDHEFKARVLSQATLAWIMAKKPGRAEAAATSAKPHRF